MNKKFIIPVIAAVIFSACAPSDVSYSTEHEETYANSAPVAFESYISYEPETIEEPTTIYIPETTTEEETTIEETTEEPTTIYIPETTTEEEITIEETTEEPTTIYIPETTVYVDPYKYHFTPEEEYLLMKVAYAETRQSWDTMLLVMNVITNRAEKYGCSITEVIYAPKQFSVVWDGTMDRLTPDANALYALEMCKLGENISQGALYFCTPAHNSWHSRALTYLFTYKGQEYYK